MHLHPLWLIYHWKLCSLWQEKTGGKIIHRAGGAVYLFRGRNYNYAARPQYPLMLWKPAAPVYPKLIQEAPGGLTKEEADELRMKGKKLLPICKLGKSPSGHILMWWGSCRSFQYLWLWVLCLMLFMVTWPMGRQASFIIMRWYACCHSRRMVDFVQQHNDVAYWTSKYALYCRTWF